MNNEELKKAAFELLLKNRKKGHSEWAKKDYEFSCPSSLTYPYQWFWDSCFHAIVFLHFDPELSKNEIRSLLSIQEPDGFIPHVIFWDRSFIRPRMKIWRFLQGKQWGLWPKHTGMMQPPVLGISIERIYQKTGDRNFLEATLPAVEKYFLWIEEHRDPDKDGLISVINPHETGLDWSPHFDETLGLHERTRQKMKLRVIGVKDRLLDLRNKIHGFDSKRILELGYYDVEDVMMNVIYAASLKALARLFEVVGDHTKSTAFAHKYHITTHALFTKCFDEKDSLFYSLWGKEEKKLRVNTFVSLMPLFLDDLGGYIAERLVKNHMLNPGEYWLPYPVPGVSKNEPSFDPKQNEFIWRGPTWMNVNWFLVQGLRKHGYNDIANEIVTKSKELIAKSGFREYFNPFTGEGYGAKNFGWSTLIVDLLEK